VLSGLSPEDQDIVRRFLAAGGVNQEVDYESAEFIAFRRYLFALARREAALGIPPDPAALDRGRRLAEGRK
jgi:hypothetical protein